MKAWKNRGNFSEEIGLIRQRLHRIIHFRLYHVCYNSVEGQKMQLQWMLVLHVQALCME